jgi:hypothetical protein
VGASGKNGKARMRMTVLELPKDIWERTSHLRKGGKGRRKDVGWVRIITIITA